MGSISDVFERVKQKPRFFKRFNSRVFLVGGLLCWVAALVSNVSANYFVPYVPENFSYEVDVTSVDNFYDESTNQYAGAQYSVSTVAFSETGRQGEVVAVDNSIDVQTISGDPIFGVVRNYAVDASSGRHVAGGDREREGSLFAPRDLRHAAPFTYWHVNYDGPANMTFVNEDTLFGVRVHHYESNYDGVTIDQTANLGHLSGVPEERGVVLEPRLELWVEPVSGWLVKYQDNTTAYYYDINTGERLNPWNQFSNTFTDDSVAEQAVVAAGLRSKLLLFKEAVPSILSLVALTLLVFAFRVKLLAVKAPVWYIGWAVVGVAALALAEWFSGTHIFEAIALGGVRINPFTAVGLVLLGLVILVIDYKQSKWRWLAWLFVAPVMFVSTVRLTEIAGLHSFEIDLTLFGQQILSDAEARMSLITALALFLLGIAAIGLLVRRFRNNRTMGVVPYIVVVVGVLGIMVQLTHYAQQISGLVFSSLSSLTGTLLIVIALMMIALRRRILGHELSVWGLSKRVGWCIVLALPLLLVVIIAEYQLRSDYTREQEVFNADTREIQLTIEERIKLYSNTLSGARGLLEASEFVSRGEWKEYIEAINVQEVYPGIQGVGFAEIFPASKLSEFEARIKSEGYPDFRVTPADEREEYTSIVFLEPFDERNQRAFGYDMFTEATRRAAMEQARDTGEFSITGKVLLLQEIDADVQNGFLMYLPFYDKSKPLATADQRRVAILGYVYAPFRAADFLNGAIGNRFGDTSITLYDGSAQLQEAELYTKPSQTTGLNGGAVALTNSRTFYVGGRPWTLAYSKSSATSNAVPIGALAIGSTLYLMLLLIVYALITARTRATEYATKVTADLRQNEARLAQAKLDTEQKLHETEHLNKLMIEQSIETQKFALAVENATDQIIIADAIGKIIYVNPAVERMTGFARSEVLGKPHNSAELWGGRMDQAFYQKMWQTIKAQKQSFESQVENHRKDGSTYFASLTASPILNMNGDVVFVVIIERDITHEKEVDKAKTEFVSLASHQLRTPLTAIGWYSQLLADGEAGKLTDTQLSLLKEIQNGNQRMVALVNSLLDVSRLELGTFSVDPEPTDVVLVAKSLVQEVEVDIFKRKQDVKEVYGVVPKINLDPQLTRIIIQNLLTNAIKYTPERGSIELTVAVQPLIEVPQQFRIANQESALMIRVKDNGIGIPQQQQERIFSKMFRADNVTNSDVQGTGLGLYIIKTIVEYTGGRIWFVSTEGKGTTFTILMPLSGMQKKLGSRKIGV